jgi:CRP/FNR family transcriptional regulator, anaerobic regulatory protein
MMSVAVLENSVCINISNTPILSKLLNGLFQEIRAKENDRMNDSPGLREKIFNLFPLFGNSAQGVQNELFEHGKLAKLPANQFICLEGSKCSCIPLVLEGWARVYKLSESGREITLYRVEPGQSCIMTASCILSGVEFPAFAATETEVEAVVIPPEILHRWVNEHEVWRRFLCGMLASRLAEVISVVEEVAFQRVDTRTAEYLLQSASADGAIKKTHRDIAMDIGTSREVVSRILKEFEHKGLITLARGEIQTENANELQRVANQAGSSRGLQPH